MKEHVADAVPRGLRLLRAFALGTAGLAAVGAGVVALGLWAGDGIGFLDLFRTALVMLATFWLAWGAVVVLIGLATPPGPRPEDRRITARTVAIVPIYNEDPPATYARIRAMAEDLAAGGLARHVDIAILSDTQDPALIALEALWFGPMSTAGAADGPRILYRRRRRNTGRKAGNIADFIRRSGAAWDFALVLDADSLMAAATIGCMIRRMQADPSLGLLQSQPAIIGAGSIFGRAGQFAGAFHGWAHARGIAALQGGAGPYWGHNALIRLEAFAESCGLPELPGPPPFGGHILSHDTVEAALLVRAGWQVRLDPDLQGSYEDGPRTLLAHAARDRRWCQGNLQHAALLTAPGLSGWSRFTLVQGILAYAAPVLWLLLLVTSLIAPALATPFEPVLIPLLGSNPLEGSMAEWLARDWAVPILPPDQAARALGLALGVVGLLVVPKLLILGVAIASGRARAYGGPAAAVVSTLAELALSVVTAPILLLYQARAVAEVLAGRDGGWPGQARGEGMTRWSGVWAKTRWITATGVVLGLLAAVMAPGPALLLWLLPVWLPLVAAPAVIRWSAAASPRALFRTPAETAPPAVLTRHAAILARWNAQAEAGDAVPAGAQAAQAALVWPGHG
ncbi:MAG: glucans biosynthesis glucosyltransferase MdoH [Rubellimicrobium sp.]|nr:glucans biosynthesis glucosyltransferase MdoH [Rubellimicrobium sp.]